MTSPLISVIVPVYNVEDYLDECVRSIMNQTHRHLEIILVDDGSTDRSAEMCDDFARKDARIRVIHKVNGGASSARNAGLDIATGQYFAFVDSDDYIMQDMYERMLAPLHDEVQLSVCSLYYQYEPGPEKVWVTQRCYEQQEYDARSYFELYHFNKFKHESVTRLYSRDHFGHLRFNVGHYAEDHRYAYLVALEMLKRNLKMVHLPYVGYYYRYVGTSIMHSYKVPMHVEETRNYRDLLKEQEAELKQFGYYEMLAQKYLGHLVRLKALSMEDETFSPYIEHEFAYEWHHSQYHLSYAWGLRHQIYYLVVRYIPMLYRNSALKTFCTKTGEIPTSTRYTYY